MKNLRYKAVVRVHKSEEPVFMHDWCRNHFGQQYSVNCSNGVWTIISDYSPYTDCITRAAYFKHKEHLTLFALKWL